MPFVKDVIITLQYNYPKHVRERQVWLTALPGATHDSMRSHRYPLLGKHYSYVLDTKLTEASNFLVQCCLDIKRLRPKRAVGSRQKHNKIIILV